METEFSRGRTGDEGSPLPRQLREGVPQADGYSSRSGLHGLMSTCLVPLTRLDTHGARSPLSSPGAPR